jgi:hypothetical protein
LEETRYPVPTVPRTEVDILLDLLDQSFQRERPPDGSDGWHSVLSNLQSVRDEDWNWVPPDGKRPICQLAIHIGIVLHMYAEFAFGSAKLRWEDVPHPDMLDKRAITEWLKECHQLMHDGLARCTDDQLDELCESWDEPQRVRRWLVHTMIAHNHYHAGEINHIRALAQKDDAWESS